MKCPSCTYENPNGITKCLICGVDIMPTPDITAPPAPLLGTAAAQQQAQPLQQTAQPPPTPPASQPAPPPQAGQPAQPAPEAKPAQPAPPPQPAPPQQPPEPDMPDPRKLKTQTKPKHDAIRIITGIFWILLGVFASLVGIFSTIDVSSFGSLTKPTIEYSTSAPWIFVGFISFAVAINLLLIRKKVGNVCLIVGVIPTILAVILVSSIMYSSFTGWSPIVKSSMLTDGILLMVGCIIFFMLLFVSKTLNEKLEFEQEQAYMVQTQEISQYTGAPFSMSFDKIMNPDYINPPIEMRMIALTVMLMIAAVIVPVVIFNSDISLLDSGSPNSLVVKYPELDATLTDNGDAANDELNVRHIQGDDLDWSEYKIVITSTADEDVTTTLNDLSSLGIINASQTSTIDWKIKGFTDIDYQAGEYYSIGIYVKKDNTRIYYKPYCNCE